jgi:hypothetical protein
MLMEDHWLREFEIKKVLRRIFCQRKDEVTGSWRKLHNEELHNFSSLPGIIRRIESRSRRWVWHLA